MTVVAAASASRPLPVAPAPSERVGTTPGDYAPIAVIFDECARHGFDPQELRWSARMLIIGYLVGREYDTGILMTEDRVRALVRSYLDATSR